MASASSPASAAAGPVPAGEAFRPWQRLRSPADYGRVWKGGQRRYPGPLVVVLRPNSQGHARLGLAISKKVLARAVARNQVKRIVRDSFRRHAASLPPYDVVISLSRRKAWPAPEALPEELRRALNSTWQHLARL